MRKDIIYRFALAAALVFAVLAPGGAARAQAAAKNVLRRDGFGGVRVGMTVAQASRALGVRLVTTETGECRYYEARRGFKDVAFMATNGVIARVDIQERGYATDRGARVGDTEARVKSLYRGRYRIEKHRYTDGHYIIVDAKGGKYSLIFETDGRRVTYIRAGRMPEAGYVEGCS